MNCRLSVLSLDTIAGADDEDEIDDFCMGQLCDNSSLVAEDNGRCCCVKVVVVLVTAPFLLSGAERIFVFSEAAPCFGEELTSKV